MSFCDACLSERLIEIARSFPFPIIQKSVLLSHLSYLHRLRRRVHHLHSHLSFRGQSIILWTTLRETHIINSSLINILYSIVAVVSHCIARLSSTHLRILLVSFMLFIQFIAMLSASAMLSIHVSSTVFRTLRSGTCRTSALIFWCGARHSFLRSVQVNTRSPSQAPFTCVLNRPLGTR